MRKILSLFISHEISFWQTVKKGFYGFGKSPEGHGLFAAAARSLLAAEVSRKHLTTILLFFAVNDVLRTKVATKNLVQRWPENGQNSPLTAY